MNVVLDALYGLTPVEARQLSEECNRACEPYSHLRTSWEKAEKLASTIERVINATGVLPRAEVVPFILTKDRAIRSFVVWHVEEPHNGTPLDERDVFLGATWMLDEDNKPQPVDMYMSREVDPYVYGMRPDRTGMGAQLSFLIEEIDRTRTDEEFENAATILFCAAQLAARRVAN